MKYPLMTLTGCILTHKKTFVKGLVPRGIQEDLVAALEINCATQLDYIATEKYPCQLLHEKAYHYSLKIGDNESMIRFSVTVLWDGEKAIETRLLFKDLQASWMKLTGVVEKDDYCVKLKCSSSYRSL